MRVAAWVVGLVTVAALAVMPPAAASTAALPAGLLALAAWAFLAVHNHREHRRR